MANYTQKSFTMELLLITAIERELGHAVAKGDTTPQQRREICRAQIIEHNLAERLCRRASFQRAFEMTYGEPLRRKVGSTTPPPDEREDEKNGDTESALA